MYFLFANGAVPSGERTEVPPQLLPYYQIVTGVAVALALGSAGVWFARRSSLANRSRRILIVAAIGMTSIAITTFVLVLNTMVGMSERRESMPWFVQNAHWILPIIGVAISLGVCRTMWKGVAGAESSKPRS